MKRLIALCAACAVASPAFADAGKEKIGHIIVISLENHSFDNVFGLFPGAEGLAQARDAAPQTDHDGSIYETLPPVRDSRQYPAIDDTRFPKLANAPFPIDRYIGATEGTGDPTHRFYQEQDQINGGRMDRFAAVSEAGGLVMGYYDGSQFGLWDYAKRFTLADHFFHAAFGGSLLNHFWLVCACTPRFAHAPDSLMMKLDAHGEMIKSGSLTPDGYAVNTIFSAQTPRPPQLSDSSKLLPPVTLPTIGDRLSDKNISWAWYAGGWNDAVAGRADKNFQYHHQPFVYFKNFAEGTKARQEHLKDEADLLEDLKNDTLPEVVFYKPEGKFNLHPGYAEMASGDAHIVELLKTIEQSKAWESSVVIVSFDENGGYWDHVAPPKIDRWGPGTRVPTLIISPMAKKHYIDHTVYDTTSILKFIEWRYNLKPLAARDARATNLLNALELN